jgi:hypothetical protein
MWWCHSKALEEWCSLQGKCLWLEITTSEITYESGSRVAFVPTFLRFKSHFKLKVENKKFKVKVEVVWYLLFFST